MHYIVAIGCDLNNFISFLWNKYINKEQQDYTSNINTSSQSFDASL